MKVAIFGAGIGGLTTAHQLSKYPNIEIDIFEKKDQIGGVARSSRDRDGCSTEYSWRVYFGFYDNLLQLMTEIPIPDSSKSVRDNLDKYHHLDISDNPITFVDTSKTFANILYGITSCDARLYELDNLSWWNSLKTTANSHVFRAIGGWFGMDRYRGSYNSVIRGIEQTSSGQYYITNKPTSEAWFNPWYEHLRKNNVKFNMESELTGIIIRNNKIISTIVVDKFGNYRPIIADYYVFCIPVDSFAKLIHNSPELMQHTYFQNIIELNKTCLHMQLSFQLYFNKQISLGINKNAFLIVDSPWDIIVLSYDIGFTNSIICHDLPNVKDAWSIAACTAYIPGIVYIKPMNQCTYDEIIIELWAQLLNSKKLKELVYQNNGFHLTTDLIVKWAPLWGTFHFNGKNLVTSEPKFTNNIGSRRLRPNFKTPIKNMYIATGYVKDTIDIYSMESAVIAGKAVAHEIIDYSDKPTYRPRPLILAPLRAMDTVYYKLNLPNLTPAIILIGTGALMGYLIYKLLKKKSRK